MSLAAHSTVSDYNAIEGFARVVAVEGAMVWLEPEQKTSCGSCASASACGGKSGPNWLQARRFRIANDDHLEVGERVVVGIAEGVVLRGAMTAYALPLFTLMVGGTMAQNWFGTDAMAALGALGGLVLGLLAARLRAARLSARGELSPRFIRRAAGSVPGTDCHVD